LPKLLQDYECPDIDKFRIQGSSYEAINGSTEDYQSSSSEFRLTFDLCHDVAEDPENDCEPRDTVESRLHSIFVDYYVYS